FNFLDGFLYRSAAGAAAIMYLCQRHAGYLAFLGAAVFFDRQVVVAGIPVEPACGQCIQRLLSSGVVRSSQGYGLLLLITRDLDPVHLLDDAGDRLDARWTAKVNALQLYFGLGPGGPGQNDQSARDGHQYESGHLLSLPR